MPVKIKTPNFSIKAEVVNMAKERAKQVCENVLNYVCEEAVTEARDRGSYTDQTGNLRSSIGYVITDGKNVVNTGEQKQYKNGTEGLSKSKKLLEEYAERHSGDVCAHVVAGMDYADYVERIHGKTVLSPARVYIDSVLPKRLEQSGLKIKVKK